jgi:ribosome-associated protein
MDNMSDKSALTANNSGELARKIAEELAEAGGGDVLLLDTGRVSDWSSYLIIGTFSSLTQGLGLLQLCEDIFKDNDIASRKTKAERGSDACWLILDADDIVIHLMNSEGRSFYSLEERWKNADIIYKSK